MNTTAEYFTTLTVKVLKGMCKDMGLKGYSALRKADIVLMLACEMNILHGKAFKPVIVSPVGDARNIIDGIEYPMNHGQFCAWFRRHGDDFEAEAAIVADHEEALAMDAEINLKRVTKEDAPHEEFDSFLTELHNTLKALAIKAEACETLAYRADMYGDSNLAEQWTTVAKDLNNALANVMWSQSYRAETSL